MAGNSLVTIDMVTREALRIAHEKLSFLGTIDRSYDDSYARTGAKIGDTLRIRMPNAYVRTKGSRIMAVQNQDERTQAVTVATQDHVDMRWNSAEMALTIDELSARYIEPAVCTLVSGIEGDVIADVTPRIYNQVGTAGTPPTDLVAVGAARAKLNQFLAPKDGNRYVMTDSVTMGGLVNGLKGLFQDSAQIREQYREGLIGRTAMADWYENEKTTSVTYGSDVTATTDAAALVTDGALASTNGVTLDMHTTKAVSATVVGEVFTIAGVYACHPETKLSYGYLQQFTVTAIGTSTVTISPQIFLTGGRQNVCSSTSTQLATTDFNSQTLVFYGSASTAYRQSLMYHKEFTTFVTADLPLMASSEKCVRRTQDNLSLRVWQDSDIRSDELLMRIDILYGWKVLRPEWACRITN
jgi:hypothetical protein